MMKKKIERSLACLVAGLMLVMSVVAVPAVVNVQDPVEEQNEVASNIRLFEDETFFHTSMQAYLNLESLISMSVCYKFSDMESIDPEEYADRVGLLVWQADEAPADTEATYANCSNVIEGAYYNSVLGRFETETDGIVAKKLGDGLTFRAYYRNENGSYEYSRIIEDYSPKTYCYNQINNNPDDEAKVELMTSILNYGAAAQKYFNYKTDDLMNADLNKEPEEEILTFSLLEDGTYGVMAGPDAATQETITIPETYDGVAVTEILTGGFKNLTVLQSILIPNSIKAINQNAFAGCVSLKSVTIPSSVVLIGKKAFYQSGLATAVFENANIEGENSWKLSESIYATFRNQEKISCFYHVYYSDYSNGDGYIVSWYCDLSNPVTAAQALSTTAITTVVTEYLGQSPVIPNQSTSTKNIDLNLVDWYVS